MKALRRNTLLCFAFAVIGCQQQPAAPKAEAAVNHVVLCWLKEPGNVAQRALIIEVSKKFRKIPGVIDVRVGESIPSDRDIVDDSFDVGICLTYASVEDMNAYLEHPDHVKAAKEVLGPIAKKIVVYDFGG